VGRLFSVELPAVNVFTTLPHGDGLCLATLTQHAFSPPHESVRRTRTKIGLGKYSPPRYQPWLIVTSCLLCCVLFACLQLELKRRTDNSATFFLLHSQELSVIIKSRFSPTDSHGIDMNIMLECTGLLYCLSFCMVVKLSL
jgi:hypothetical protein